MPILTVFGILLLAGLAWWAVVSLPVIPDPIKQILKIIIVVLVAGFLISLFFGVNWNTVTNIRIGK